MVDNRFTYSPQYVRRPVPTQSPWIILAEMVATTALARILSRRYVRQGVAPADAAVRAVDSMMMSCASGAVIVLWLILALPTWIIPVFSRVPPERALLWMMSVTTDVAIFGLPLVAIWVYVQVVEERRSEWQRAITRPAVILGSLVAIWPAKIAALLTIGLFAAVIG